MPKKVSQLEQENRSNLTNAFQVLVTDPTNFELYRVPVKQFRGASVFVSDNNPSDTPEDPLIQEYVEGDIFIKDSNDGQQLFIWDNTNSRWEDAKKLNGIRLLSAEDFPDETDLDLRDTNFTDEKIYNNDFYLNKSISIIYGPYSDTTGFKFSNRDFTGYQAIRASVTFSLVGDNTQGYDDPVPYINEYYNGIKGDLTPVEKKSLITPANKDKYHIIYEDDEGHGGWVWEFDWSAPVSNPNASRDVLLAEKLRVGQSGAKKHYRPATTFNTVTVPEQNDKKYRQGDNVFVVSEGILFYNYQEGLPEGTTDLSLVFEGQTVLKGSSLLTSQDDDGNWIDPIRDDSIYKNGDYILTKSKGTPRIHGPYSASMSTDLEAWPLFSVLRDPYNHNKPTGEYSEWGVYENISSPTPYPEINGIMVVDGDTITEVFTDNIKEYKFYKGCDVTVDNTSTSAPYSPIVEWYKDVKTPVHAARISTSSSIAEPSLDTNIYYDKELVRNKIGEMYCFVEDYNTQANSYFEPLEHLRAVITHFVDTPDGNYIPDTKQNSLDWGESTVMSGDTLEVRTGSAPDLKVVLYTAEIDDATGDIIWRDRRNKFGEKLWQTTDVDHPPVANNNKYTDGDRIVTGSGIEYIYNEDLVNAGANPNFTFYQWRRGTKTFVDYGTSPDVDTSINDYSAVFGVSLNGQALKVGDKLRYVYTPIDGDPANPTGKEKVKVVLQEFPLVLSDWKNPNPTKIWSGSSVNRNEKDDLLYSAGDFIDNALTGWRYGPYVEGADSNLLAWPDFRELEGTEKSLSEHNPNKRYEEGDTAIYQGDVYSANSTILGDQTAVPFQEGTGANEWTLAFKGGGRLIDKDNPSNRPALYVKDGLLTLDRTN